MTKSGCARTHILHESSNEYPKRWCHGCVLFILLWEAGGLGEMVFDWNRFPKNENKKGQYRMLFTSKRPCSTGRPFSEFLPFCSCRNENSPFSISEILWLEQCRIIIFCCLGFFHSIYLPREIKLVSFSYFILYPLE